MTLHYVDVAIIIGYLCLTVFIGFLVSKRASKNMRAYFLGGNNLPWYALGLSNASGMFDIAGTMWMVALLFIYGLNSVFIPWLWPVFNQIFLMIFLAAWLRRSGVMTGAEWIGFRFGDNTGARLSHFIIVAFALITVLGYMAFGFLGIGKLAAEFLPFTFSGDPATNEKIYALILVGLTTIYVVKGGMYSVVLTEVMQFIIMLIACIGIAWVAFANTDAAQIAAAVPEGWASLSAPWKLDLDWSGLVPAANDKIASEGYEFFALFLGMVLLKGIFQSLAGPAPNYDMQRILSARSPKEASLMSGLVSLVLLFPRYLFIAGLVVLSLVHFSDELNAMGPAIDFEGVLPMALSNFIPVGLLGLVLAGLLAAFMSSFAAALNAAPAYLVNDVYKRFINPDADSKVYVRLSYLASALFVIIGVTIGLFLQNIETIVIWITSALFGGFAGANVLKWLWWRMNGYGYFAGMLVGILFALLMNFPQFDVMNMVTTMVFEAIGLEAVRVDAVMAFPIFFICCIAAAIVGSLLTPPDDMEVLKQFYVRTRPWGLWGPVLEALETGGHQVSPNRDFALDMFNVAVGIVWQTALVISAILLVLQMWGEFAVALLVVVATMAILKFTWFDRLDRKEYEVEREIRKFEFEQAKV